MAKTYIPKVGDKVRATLGENVLVGKITYSNPTTVSVDILVGIAPVFAIALDGSDGWHFEQVIDVPTKPFAVVVSQDGSAGYILTPLSESWRSTQSGAFASDATIADLIRDEGYRVVFEGIDE